MTDEHTSSAPSRGTKRKPTDSSPQPPRERTHEQQRSGPKPTSSAPNNAPSPSDPPQENDQPESKSPPRKRPTARAAISKNQIEAARRRAEERQVAQQQEVKRTREGVQDAVTQHYNLVPERGRDWRRTDSKIKGLRSYNNWVKSCIIQKFAKDWAQQGSYAPIKVLDIGCGKGGDLQKWQSAPQRVELYVGLDPAEVSIQQARERYVSMQRQNQDRGRQQDRRRKQLFHGEFMVRDCFGKPIEEVRIIQQVGFDGGVGPGQVQRWGGGGFDVVSMMFCLHYSFESEEKAKCMIRNVAGSMKKGARFLGVIPNSAVLSEKVKEHHARQAELKGSKSAPPADEDDWDPEKSLDTGNAPVNGDTSRPPANDDDDDWDPEKSLDNRPTESAPESVPDIRPPWGDDDDDDWDPEKSLDTRKPEAEEATELSQPKPEKKVEGFEWGNSIYRVKFPGATPPDGMFRPPFGWKYFYFLEEAVEEVPEYVVPWEAFRALAEDYGLELRYYKPFREVWEEERNDRYLGPLSERMNVRDRDTGRLRISAEEMEAASFYSAFCFVKV